MTNNLDNNLELRKALAEVDRLTAENVELKEMQKDLKDDVNRLTKEVSIVLNLLGSISKIKI